MLTTSLVDKSGDEETFLLNEIIGFNRNRILSRLRSTHAIRTIKNQDRPLVISRLAEAVSTASGHIGVQPMPNVDLEAIKFETKRLEDASRELEFMSTRQARSLDSNQVLSNLLTCAYKLSLRDDLETAIESIPRSGKFGPGTGHSLRQSIGKLGRYYSACRFLVLAARKMTIFKNIRVECDSSSTPAGFPLLATQRDISLSSTLNRVMQLKSSADMKSMILQLQENAGVNLPSAEVEFRKRLNLSRNSCKVHAEIQLIFYYESHPNCIPPRVICSSKSACFMCNLFNELHGKFYIARTHGVLYEKWMLPDPGTIKLLAAQSKVMAEVVQQLNADLENRIRGALQRQKMRRHHPNESVFIDPAVWTPSVQSLATRVSPQASVSASASPKSQSDSMNAHEINKSAGSSSENNLTIEKRRSSTTTVSRLITHAVERPPFPVVSSVSQISANSLGESLKPKSQDRQASIFKRDLGDPIADPPHHFVAQINNGVCERLQPVLLPDALPEKHTLSSIESSTNKTVLENPETEPVHSQTSRSSFRDVENPMPLLMRSNDQVTKTYEPLIQGNTIQRELMASGPPVMLATRHIHLALSLDGIGTEESGFVKTGGGKHKDSSGCNGRVWVTVKWLRRDEELVRSDDGGKNIVNLDSIGKCLEETFSHGAAESSTPLYVVRKVDVLGIKYATEALFSLYQMCQSDFQRNIIIDWLRGVVPKG